MKINININKQNLINTTYYIIAFFVIVLYFATTIFIRLRFIITHNEAAKKDIKFAPILEELFPLTSVIMFVGVLIYHSRKYVNMDVFMLFFVVAILAMINSAAKIKYVDQYSETKGAEIFQPLASFVIIIEYAILFYMQYKQNKYLRNMRIIFAVSILILLTLSMLLF